MKKYDFWDEVYRMDGFGLSDYLNDFDKANVYKASQHGERVWLEESGNADYDVLYTEIFGDWSKWMESVSIHYGAFLDVIDENCWPIPEDDVKTLFIYKLCVILGILDEDEMDLDKPKYSGVLIFA